MGDSSLEKWLTEHKRQSQRALSKARTIEIRWSTGRLLLFVGAVAVWFFFDGQPLLAGGLCAALLTSFACAVQRHGRARDRRERLDQLLIMIDESRRRCSGQVVLIRGNKQPVGAAKQAADLPPMFEVGPTWATTAQERDDLDLYGDPVGIFGLLNRTSTGLGVRRLSHLLNHPSRSHTHIRARQDAVAWLQDHRERRLAMMAAAAVLRSKSQHLDRLVTAIRNAKPLAWPKQSRTLRAWSAISLFLTAIIVANVGSGQYAWVYAFALLLLVNGGLYWQIRRELSAILEPWKSLGPASKAYFHAATEAAALLPTDAILGKLGSAFQKVLPRKVLPTLSRRVLWAESDGMFHTVCNALYFYDLHVVEAILAPAAGHRTELLEGLAALADLEAFCSLACFADESAAGGPTCYPAIVSEPTLEITEGRHPLLDPMKAIPNSLHLTPNRRLQVVTGSNMAGKSTYLRMCGVNCLLAQVGTVALAKDMTLSPLGLITDLQVRDNLSDDESYFLAEVRQVHRMIVPDVEGLAHLGLIDEPFRGTNSSEQVAAALAVLEHLHQTGNLFVLATHEHRLTELAEACPAADNMHFQENLGSDGLIFDYTIRSGPAKTRNALHVLEREGYPAELIARARAWLREDGYATEADTQQLNIQ